MMPIPGWSAAAVAHLPSALLHSLWQGLVITLLVFVLLRRIPVTKPELRYGVAVAGLLGVVLALLLTWSFLERPPSTKGAPELSASSSAAGSTRAVGDPADTTPLTPRAFPPRPLTPSTYLLFGWFAGAVVMMARILWLMRGTHTLRTRCRVPDDAALSDLLESVKKAIGMSRRVVIMVVDELTSPVAMGLFWPVIVLPVTMLTGLSQEQLRAVLAHELAHIRRYDYLVNYLQLIIEALLYFNPAVWWLSRHISMEREACCDALAARISGGAIDYASALVQIARGMRGGAPLPAMAQGFGVERGPGGILDRTRRLLLPGYWPRLRLRWYSIALGALISVAMLLGLYQSSVLSVAFMGWVFSDKERIEVMSRLSQEYNSRPEPEDYAKLERVEVSGTLITTDGKPLPKPERGNYVHTLSQRKTAHSRSSESGGVDLDGNRFRAKMIVGDLYIFAEFPGYAPTFVGPLHGDAQHPVENVEVRLIPSQPATIRFTDEDGTPIMGVKVDGCYKFLPDSGSLSIQGRSEDAGTIQFDQAKPPVPVDLEATAKGYAQARNANLVVEAGQRFDWVLEPEEPFDVYVVDRRNGAPIAGAGVALVYERGRGFKNDENGTVLATSDDSGHAILHGRNKSQMYALLVRAHGFGTEMISCSQGTTTPVKVGLTPRYVRGTIRGDLALLKKGEKGSGPVVTSGMPLEIPGESVSYGADWHDTPVSVKDGVGSFSIEDLRAGELYIKAGPEQVRVPVSNPVEDLEITVGAAKPKPYRLLRLELPVPDGAPVAKGAVGIQITSNGLQSELTSRKVGIADGLGTTSVQVPATVRIVADGLAGYIPKPLAKEDRYRAIQGWDIPDGAEPFVISLPLERAGAIYGSVVKADGTPASNAHIYVRATSAAGDAQWPYHYLCPDTTNVDCNGEGKFAVLPLPFNLDFEVSASIELASAKKTINLSASKPMCHEQFQLPSGIDVAVRILKPDGTPAVDTPLGIETIGHGYSGMRTDDTGRYVFHGADPTVEYWVTTRPDASFQGGRVKAPLDGKELVIHLVRGLSVEGIVLGFGTETPVPNHKVNAVRKIMGSNANPIPRYEVETSTNNEGKYRFTNLAPGEYVVTPDSFSNSTDSAEEATRTFAAGQKEPAVIHIRPSKAERK